MKKLLCATYEGVDAKLVHVESTLTKGLPSFSIVGMASASITEAKERVKSALLSNNFTFPPKRITINLAPSDLKKEGSHFDLGMALLILLNDKEVDLKEWGVFGELGLDGSVKSNSVLYPLLLSLANQQAITKALVPKDALQQLSNIPNIEFYGVSHLNEAFEFLNGTTKLQPLKQKQFTHKYLTYNKQNFYYQEEYKEDFLDVLGQEVAKKAALIAAAGFHNIVLEGSPGCGKSMIAKRLHYILPPLSQQEILEVAKLEALDTKEVSFKPLRAFRAPHHSSTQASIFGGGSHKAQIGEVGLANGGILFFDELPHFSKNVLEALREPMQDKKIRISRVNVKVQYDANFLFVGAMNPCPCGNLLDETKECRCSDVEIARYKNRLSEPFLDRIELYVVMQQVQPNDKPSLSSKDMHTMVRDAFLFAKQRGQNVFNAHLDDTQIEQFCFLTNEANEVLELAARRFGLSFRVIKNIKKVARTIADLAKSKEIDKIHILEALSYRRRD